MRKGLPKTQSQDKLDDSQQQAAQRTAATEKHASIARVGSNNTYANIAANGPRSQYIAQLQSLANASTSAPVQLKSDEGGLPGKLQTGIESLSGMSMDHVRVHYNSSKPAQLQAHAFAQGSEIHLAPGQEKHLPHEAWHVVQQAQGRVKPTLQMKKGVAINDDKGLEREADEMGAEAMKGAQSSKPVQRKQVNDKTQPVQLKGGRKTKLGEEKTVLKLVLPGSSYKLWATHTEKDIETMTPLKVKASAKGQLAWKNPDPEKWEVTIAGPQAWKGTRDVGGNSIENNYYLGYNLLTTKLAELASEGVDLNTVTILIKGHSRNAVAATKIANGITALWGKKGLSVELVVFDPVPGPGHSGEDEEITLKSSITSTVVYSMHTGYATGFDPQIVKGAKRMVLSLQQHDAGLTRYFNYNGKVYKGSDLNSLPEGLYASEGTGWKISTDSKNNEKIKKLSSIDEVKKFLKENPAGRTEFTRRAYIQMRAFAFKFPVSAVDSEAKMDT